MGLQGFSKAQRLYKLGHVPKRIGFDGDGGDVTRLSTRIHVARAFRGIELEGIGKETVVGYNALFQVFLTHSALERFLKLNKLRLDTLEAALQDYEPHLVVVKFFQIDKGGRLYDFLHERLEGSMPEKLRRCRDGESANVGHISASIRHIFVHGHLASRSYRITPGRLADSCRLISDFLLNFMDRHFEQKIDDYCVRKNIVL